MDGGRVCVYKCMCVEKKKERKKRVPTSGYF